ncbi:hypothetical protein KUTeg_000284 [Tegillarca granosa]|uniref:Diacylglycerol kinase n=1 Tax=Tegillarca granosa TaxID=220873 RepID=A0ABQ9FX39_TEGGR|nr:hypothetical protein KUTeg_000284 [Tegillarca granosa]
MDDGTILPHQPVVGEMGGDTPESSDQGHGHFFVKKTFHKPTYCHHCTDMLWGLIGQGFICEVCNFVVHERCLKTVVSPCSSIATNLIKNPVAHCWSEPGHFKRKFCNICRKRLEDNLAIRCELCEYYAHIECQDFVVSDCKETATYVPNKELLNVVHYHHWREGNLPANSKCVACKKTCWSSECLAGMRCEWCGVTIKLEKGLVLRSAHAGCYRSLPAECNFGTLREIMLPPSCLTIPRMEVSMETILGFNKRCEFCLNITDRPVSEEWPSSGESKNDDEEKERRSPPEIIRVFDGNASMKKKLYRTISVPKNAPAQAILEAALKTFHISDDPKNYYVAEAWEMGERELEENSPIRQQLKTPDGKRLSLFLRYKERDPDKGHIKVYPGGLRVSSGYKNIEVTSDMTTEDVIKTALRKFGSQDAHTERFCLIEVLLDKGDSLRQNRMTRYYLQQREDPHGPSISLFVGNLPTGLSQRQYEKILIDIIGKADKWHKFDVIYYEYGALVLVYTTSEKATRVFNRLSNASFDEKSLLVLLLPNIQTHMIQETAVPLLVCVNVKSGGCQGLELITSFRKLLNPHQVFNLENGGPLPGLYVFRNIPYYRILVCGGDGTVGWVLSCLDNVGQDGVCESPPLAIVPLGTEQDETKVAIANETNTSNTNEDTTTIFVMNNYFGIGIDADLCQEFHKAREEKPDKFNSRLHNKRVYVTIGLKKMVNRKAFKDLHRNIRVEVDGKLIDLPPIEGIIILNILSWGSGANPWGPEREDQFSKPTHHDGMLEVVGVTGVVHMGQIQSGLRTGIRIAQGGHATMLKKSKNKIKRRNTEPSIFFPDNEQLRLQSPTEESEPL